MRTQWTADELPAEQRTLREAIEAAVPLSAGRYNHVVTREHVRQRLADIPGMGTRSYVVTGKGYAPALDSAPHGAGREYGRMHAKRTFSYEQLVASMDGIEWSGSQAFVDEIPGADKDIDVVMHDERDLVEIVHTLRQIIDVKGAWPQAARPTEVGPSYGSTSMRRAEVTKAPD